MRGMMFIVENKEHSEEIQEELFSQGYSWVEGGKVIKNTGAARLFTNKDRGQILWGSSSDEKYKETTLDELYLMNPNRKPTSMESMKFRIESPIHSEMIQDELTALGFNWRVNKDGKRFQRTEAPFMFAYASNMIITVTDSESHFKDKDFVETTLEDLYKMQPKNV